MLIQVIMRLLLILLKLIFWLLLITTLFKRFGKELSRIHPGNPELYVVLILDDGNGSNHGSSETTGLGLIIGGVLSGFNTGIASGSRLKILRKFLRARLSSML
jgi:hypothetical protein